MRNTLKITIAMTATLLALPTTPWAALSTSNQSCMTSPGQWSGFMCAVDQNGNNIVDDCSDMQICYRPTIGQCTQSTTPIGFECILPNGTKVPCGTDTCPVGYPACEVQGGVQSPKYNYTCSTGSTEPSDQFYEDQLIVGLGVDTFAKFDTDSTGSKMTITNFWSTAAFSLLGFAATPNQSCTIQKTQDTTITGSTNNLVFQGGCILSFSNDVAFTGTTTHYATPPALPAGTNGQCDWTPMIGITWRTKIGAYYALLPIVPSNPVCDGRRVTNGEISIGPWPPTAGGTYDTIEQCQASCGASCDCPAPGSYNQTISKCTEEPIYQCPPPYTYDTGYMECIKDRQCPDQTVWNQDYGKCVGDPVITCPDPTLIFNPSTQKCEKPPECPAPGSWDPIFLGTGKCTAIGDVNCGSYTFDPNTGMCDAGPATCTGGTLDPADQRCEVMSPPPDCDTANGYVYDVSGLCLRAPACAAGSWVYANDRCESSSSTNYQCNYNGQTYPDSATCQANCRQYANCAVGSVSGSAQYGWLQPSMPTSFDFAIQGGGTQFRVGTAVTTLVGFYGTDKVCTVDNTTGGFSITVTSSGGNTTMSVNGCTLQFTGVLMSGSIIWSPYEWESWKFTVGYPNSGYLLYGLAQNYSGNQPGYISIGGCPLAGGTSCTGTPPTCYVQQGCTISSGCPIGWTPSGSICYHTGYCPGAGTLQIDYGGTENNDRCMKVPTITCPSGMTYDSAHNTATFPGPVCYHNTDCPAGFFPQNGECVGAGAGTCPAGYPNKDTTTGKCWIDPICTAGIYDPSGKMCSADATITCPNAAQTTYDPTINKCTAESACPAPGTYDPLIDKCAMPGTPGCDSPYTYEAVNNRCVYTLTCTPSDWICPPDSADPTCNGTAPITKKTYVEIGTGTTDSTGHYTPPVTYMFAMTSTQMSYQAYNDTPPAGAHTAVLDYKDQIVAGYGNGPLWVQGGVLYNDVFLNQTTCYSYQDFGTPPRTWQPKQYQSVACAHWPSQWERVETGCLCKTFQDEVTTRTCSATAPYYTEAVATTDVPVDTSTCTGTPISYCQAGLSQDGLNQCSANIVNYGADITCPIDANNNVTIQGTKTIRTCKEQINGVSFPVETRTVPTNNFGIYQWDSTPCKPCQEYHAVETIPETPKEPEQPPYDPSTCTNFRIFSGTDRRCHESGAETFFTDCCDLDGWFPSWCDNEEKELKKRRLAGTCHEIGNYCSKRIKFLFVKMCVQKKRTYCCFNSKLSRILNEQIRPQLPKPWGSPEKPDCKGFTPEEFAKADFSRVDLQEYVDDIQANTGKGTSDILKGMNEWIQEQYVNPGNPAPATKKE